MITALKKIYAFSGRWKRVLKKSVVFSLLHSIFDMFQIGALFSTSLIVVVTVEVRSPRLWLLK